MIPYVTRRLVLKGYSIRMPLPPRLVRALGWRAGDDLLIWRDDSGDLRIRSKGHSSSSSPMLAKREDPT